MENTDLKERQTAVLNVKQFRDPKTVPQKNNFF